MKKAQRIMQLENVGRAFHCTDGIIRWVTNLSTRGFYSVLWRSRENDVWHSGGIIRPADFYDLVVKEVPAPQPGDEYRMAGATGVVATFKMLESGRSGSIP